MITSLHQRTIKNDSLHDLLIAWCLGVVILFPWVFVFALPPLQMGIWLNTDGVAFAIGTLGTISSLTLFWIYGFHAPNQFLSKNILKNHPLVAGTLGLSILSALFLPLSYNLHLSWFGHPELMNGGWIWLATSMIVLCYLWLRQENPTQLRAIRLNTELASYAQIALVLVGHPKFAYATGDWVLYHFTSHLGWISAVLLLLSLGKTGVLAWIPRAAAILAIILSQNKLAIGAIIVGPTLYLFTSNYVNPKIKWKALLISLLLSPIILLLMEYCSFRWGIFPSLSSRFISVSILWKDYLNTPFINLLTGMGWGQMSDAIIRQSSLLQGAEWEGIGRFDASSLNQTADALSAVGIIGALLSLFIPLSPFLMFKNDFCESRRPLKLNSHKAVLFTACLMIMLLYHGWFLMLSVFPIFISAVMSLDCSSLEVTIKNDELIKTHNIQMGSCFTSGIIAFSLLWTSHSIYSTAIYYSGHLTSSIPVKLAWKLNTDFLFNCQNLVRHKGPGSITLAFWLRSFLSEKKSTIDSNNAIKEEIRCALQSICQETQKPSLILLSQIKDEGFAERQLFDGIKLSGMVWNKTLLPQQKG